MPAIVIGMSRWSGFDACRSPSTRRVAAFPVALERVARHARPRNTRSSKCGTGAWRRSRGCRRCPRSPRAGSRGWSDGRTAPTRAAGSSAHQYSPRDRCRSCRAARIRSAGTPRAEAVTPRARAARRAGPACSARISFSTQSAPRPATVAAHVQPSLVERVAERVTRVADTTRRPFWAMNALMWPTEPWTTMSTPFIEMPQRAEASPWMTTSRPGPWRPPTGSRCPRPRRTRT